jgi:hypothetical protein
MSQKVSGKYKDAATMRGFFWGGLIFFVLLLICLLMPYDVAGLEGKRRCPRTNAEAAQRGVLGLRGRCYEVFTCTEECGKSLQKLVDASEDAFADKYQVEHATVSGAAGIHLSHHISKERAQFAVEVSCA